MPVTSLTQQLQVMLLLVLSAFLSGLIGAERERREKSAGLRTHMLVGIGSCLFTAVSRYAFPDGDPTRIASNVVTGVGFLGAGIIFQGKNRVRDLTTAASIWVTAAVGVTVGVGFWLLAIFAVVLVWYVLVILRAFEPKASDFKQKEKSAKNVEAASTQED